MKLFTVGPTQMYDWTLEVASKQTPYFRTDEFSKVVLESVKKLKILLKAPEDSKLIYITGSGSAAMEAVVSNAFDKEDKLLIINGGTFGARFVKLANIYNIPYEEIKLEYGEILKQENFNKFDLDTFTAVLINIDETSTGQLYDLELISNICKQNNLFLIVDSISSFLADPYDVTKYNIDCTIISSQKALAINPGLSIINLSNNFYTKKIKDKKPINLYLNINEHVVNMERGQTPNTPAVSIILELAERLKRINSAEEENEKVLGRALYFRNKIKNLNFKIPDYPLSNALTPIIVPDDKASYLFEELKNRYEIFVNPTGGINADKILRISHLGNLKNEDYDELINKMKEVLK